MESLIEFTDAVITTAEEEALYFPPIELRHLPGKHNQKHHGRGGGAGDYTPGAWKAEEVDREAKIRETQAMLERDMTSWLRERAEAADGPEWSRIAAEEIVGDFDVSGTVYRNGPHVVAFESKKVTPAQQKRLLDDIDSLQTKAPVDELQLRVQDSSKFPWDIHGETLVGHGSIRLNERIWTDYEANGLPYNNGNNIIPAGRSVKASTFVLHHEWGHALDDQSTGAALDPGEFNLRGMSTYGSTDGYEQYAEAFAEWSLTGGGTSVPAALEYADFYGWGKRWPSLLTTSKAA